ncbi:MAG: secondary thiamine-phosphate synthase enzyme YjbQ [Thermodesulfobacteriota bacterium]
MAVHTSFVQLESRGFSDVIDITEDVTYGIRDAGIRNGIVSIFVPGSTGSVTTIEYEEGVIEDLMAAIEKLAPSHITYNHDRRWGDGNGFSHVRAALLKPGVTVPVIDGAPSLGTWQQVVFIDFDNRPRKRRIVVQIIGE